MVDFLIGEMVGSLEEEGDFLIEEMIDFREAPAEEEAVATAIGEEPCTHQS